MESRFRSHSTHRHVQNDNCRNEANANSANDPPGAHESKTGGGSFENATDDEDPATCDDGGSTSNEIGDITGDQSAKKGAEGENGGGQRLIACWQMEGFDGGVIVGVGVGLAGILTDEVRHGQYTTHPARVIAEEDTTKGSKGANEIGAHGDGGLEARHVGRPRDDDGCSSSSRHDGGGVC